MSGKTLGVFYHVYKNRKATDFVLKNFRKHFPDSKVALISDGGDDLSDLGKRYSCDYFWFENLFGNFRTVKSYRYGKDQVKEWWKRQKLTCDVTNADYIMILEDDVLIRDNFRINKDFHLCGTNGPWKLSPRMILDIKEKSGIDNTSYGMNGGSIYNKNTFLSIYEDTIDDIEKNHDIMMLDGKGYAKLGAVDANMTYHFAKRGYQFEQSPWLVQLGVGKNRENPERVKNQERYPIVHYKGTFSSRHTKRSLQMKME